MDVRDREEWREWLAANHATSSGVWLVMQKKGSPHPGPTYDEAVEEALAFGWIDSTTNRLDAASFKQYFSPRKARSAWAASNKARVERLIADGRMKPAGLAAVEAAKRDGSWSILDRIDSLEVPEDLREALDERPGARAGFDGLPASARKMALYWIATAKRPETRAVRIAKTVTDAAEGRAAAQWRRPD
jgi:uncharacterized protein YdeI (YjbR/CyaY-like superfamily)